MVMILIDDEVSSILDSPLTIDDGWIKKLMLKNFSECSIMVDRKTSITATKVELRCVTVSNKFALNRIDLSSSAEVYESWITNGNI